MNAAFWSILIIGGLSLVAGCSAEKIELQINARMDGQPAPGVTVTVDGKNEGVTDANGSFLKILKKKPGAVEVLAAKEMPGYRIKPWRGSFFIKPSTAGAVERCSFRVDLESTRYITITATENDVPDPGGINAALGKADVTRVFGPHIIPIPDAVITISGKQMGKTDAKGNFVYEYQAMPEAPVEIVVSKPGYALWSKTTKVWAGQKLEAVLNAQ